MILTVVDRGGKRTRVRCAYCPTMIEVRTRREKKCGSTCKPCLDSMLDTIIAHARAQMSDGTPANMRWIMMPRDNAVPLAFIDVIRDAICAIDPPRPELVPASRRRLATVRHR